MAVGTQNLLNLFDAASQAHGWASDHGTKAQAQTALENYQRTRKDLEQVLDHIDAQAAQLAAYPADWREDSSLGTWFPLTAAQLEAQAAEIARLREALRWYSAKAKQMGGAAIRSDSKGMLALMHEIAVDDGRRARAALSGEGN